MLDFVNMEWVWIDILCILYSNKVIEIFCMRSYYKNVEVVFVVFDINKGDYDLRVLEVIDLEYRMGSREWMYILFSSLERLIEEYVLFEEGIMVYNILCKMFKVKWFKRGWMLQEVLLGKDIIIWNGSIFVSVINVRKCLDCLGSVFFDVLNGLKMDDDYSVMQNIFNIDSINIFFEIVY